MLKAPADWRGLLCVPPRSAFSQQIPVRRGTRATLIARDERSRNQRVKRSTPRIWFFVHEVPRVIKCEMPFPDARMRKQRMHERQASRTQAVTVVLPHELFGKTLHAA